MGGSTTPTTTTTQAQIPDFLKPYLTTQANVGQNALTSLNGQLQNAGADQLVAKYDTGMTPGQMQYQKMVSAALDPNGLITNSLRGVNNFQQAGNGFVDRNVGTYEQGINQAINGQFVPGAATNTLTNYAQNPFSLDPTAQGALRSTANGDYLYGSPGFNAAVDASIRQARPQILGSFAQGGSGAVHSGLAQTAMQQAASDAFARLYGDERNRQLSAADQLGQFQLSGQGQQIGAAGTLGGLGVQTQQVRNQAISDLGNNLSQERQRQLTALGLPTQIGMTALNAQGNVANMEQANKDSAFTYDQSKLMAPITAQQMLLAATQGIPWGSLMGQQQNGTLYRNQGAGILGGAMGGAELGSKFGPMGTGIGAVAGGLLGGWG